MKKSESNTKRKVMKFFQSKTGNNISLTYKPEKIRDIFESKYVECKSKKDYQ